jgi:hypothetical protein
MKRLILQLLPILLSAIGICVMVQGQSRSREIELAELMDRVGQRVKAYYLALQQFAWTDTVRQQSLRDDRTPQGTPRDLVYDMIIRIDPAVPRDGVPSPLPPFFTKDLSELISVDGKPFLKDDSPERSDPKAGDIGLLWILLWAPRRTDHSYEFSSAGRVDLEGRKTLMFDITYSPRWYTVGPSVRPLDVLPVGNLNRVPAVVWQGDSFSVAVQQTGRIWIDPDSYDVLRLETRTKPFEFERPDGRGKLKFEFAMTARFRSMTFENPQQTLMVPDSIETVRTIKGMQPPLVRTTHTFGNFKRFAADVKIIP